MIVRIKEPVVSYIFFRDIYMLFIIMNRNIIEFYSETVDFAKGKIEGESMSYQLGMTELWMQPTKYADVEE